MNDEVVFGDICTRIKDTDVEDIFKNRYSSIAKILGLDYFSLEADSINVDNSKSRRTIIPQIYNESNYFKDLIVKVQKLKNILNFNN